MITLISEKIHYYKMNINLCGAKFSFKYDKSYVNKKILSELIKDFIAAALYDAKCKQLALYKYHKESGNLRWVANTNIYLGDRNFHKENEEKDVILDYLINYRQTEIEKIFTQQGATHG